MPITLRNTVQRGLIGNEWGTPTIYIDPNTNEIVKSDKIVAIGVTNPDYKISLPEYTTVIQVGTNVKGVHYINVPDNIIPEDIFKTATNVTDFSGVFKNSNIEKIPTGLFDNCTKATNFTHAFSNCHNIEAIPEGLFDHCSRVTSFTVTFYQCNRLKSIPDRLFSHCSEAMYFENTFSSCEHLSEIPSNLFEHCTKAINFYGTFELCTKITSVPKGLFDDCSSAAFFNRTFYGCLGLKSIPEDLFQNADPKAMYFKRTFAECSQLEGKMPIAVAPDGKQYKLWELEGVSGYPNNINGYQCFKGCRKLTGYETIPDNWK